MVFQVVSEIAPTLDSLRANSVAPTVPWGLNPVAVGAIASSVSAVITASALIIALRTYLHNSRATAQSQAALVAARVSISKPIRTSDGGEYSPAEIRITNSSDADVYRLSLYLHSRSTGVRFKNDIRLKVVMSHLHGGPLMRARGLWVLADGAIIPPGTSTLRLLLDHDQLWSRIGVGFLDRNGRNWTRWTDGELVEDWKI